ncbi:MULTISPECIES: response regulator [Alkalihalophilus]|jgi:two-component system response regulator (stage 0 sporulation protein F)|uniref:Two-component response regulator n=3 Tax=Alkalihalophilus TaxID=2893060 RepID=D3FPQ1_ALKPO|nr:MULTISPECIES: response regulator [Alkalihalophilus]ADC49461.1 two-component response regulator [Alkalihalophilus pseudofirmus OF4]ERN51947.1 chemotaxis protein CheY [Alkalihalophilus marmarensis DSM 21297]MCM3489731.1 response regulator [Alkalihalophilus marmarensis]MDV2886498.1 response regulator [Alkalihalophilus pseudofirmus]MEC2073512.1 response regulator [Alkalihalophilus marmarensis]
MHKVLVVDDQYGIRVLLSEILQKDGYQLYQAANGVQALKVVEEESPDLVLLDMKIPGMDGLEILRRIKEKHEEVQVIMMTAYGELNLINEAMQLGAITHFAKPFDIDDVRKVIKDHLVTS